MRLGTYEGKVHMILETPEGIKGLSVNEFSKGRFPGCTRALCENWEEFTSLAKMAKPFDFNVNINKEKLGPPIYNSRQIFAIGLNYKNHVEEIKMEVGKPDVFTKFISSISGPYDNVTLSSDTVDWEVELVAVIGKGGRNIKREDALDNVVGYMIGQDFSDRTAQFMGSAKQFSMGKSFAGFSPVGPWITTLDELKNPLDLSIECRVNGQVMQSSRTEMTINNIDVIIESLSEIVELYPGDLIFSGTPGGVGFGRNPKVFLKAGDIVTGEIEGLGKIEQKMVR
ncbi:MAG: fumarylacetoacetate hydrolase family protein [Clostridiales bacterium]|jgi:2-keto-4-pentenoate hydratase/2-oxohepta-3-ene-1,7-dioic acid hydratase in catechol pathway|nr:fumarylacetoacetate hydrolase family protein [Clostridiales bacterium]